MKNKLKIDLVSDVVCPWCTIGYKRLEKAITELAIEDRVDIEWQPFELNPQMPVAGENILEHLSGKYGSSLEDLRKSQAMLTALGAAVGFTFNFADDMRMVNTFEAHVLLDYARENGKQTALALRLATDFYTHRKDVADRSVLMEAITAVGLEVEEAQHRLANDETRYAVRSNEALWQQRGVTSVPTIVFNNKMAVTGAQPVDVFKEVLTELIHQK